MNIDVNLRPARGSFGQYAEITGLNINRDNVIRALFSPEVKAAKGFLQSDCKGRAGEPDYFMIEFWVEDAVKIAFAMRKIKEIMWEK